MPWKTGIGFPHNMVSKRAYTGFNFFYLLSLQFSSPWFLTWNQIQDLGGKVVKGSKSSRVVFWKILEFDDSGSKTEIPYLQYYNVFNLSQVEGIDKKHLPESSELEHDFNPISDAERFVEFWYDAPVIRQGYDQACYVPLNDEVRVPDPKSFIQDEYYYSTLFHELVHATGNCKRIGRHAQIKNHQSVYQDYSQEELVAELGAAYFCAMLGIEQVTIENNAAYIENWLKTFRNDRKILVTASSQAQRAVDYIMSHQKVSEQMRAR